MVVRRAKSARGYSSDIAGREGFTRARQRVAIFEVVDGRGIG
jgi:hypothetical protein